MPTIRAYSTHADNGSGSDNSSNASHPANAPTTSQIQATLPSKQSTFWRPISYIIGSESIVYPSCCQPNEERAGLFYPDLAANPVQVRHFDHHRDGVRVDLYREVGTVYRIMAER